MRKPVLVIMAAGMGSRYGGLKQLDPVDPEGHIIMDFSIYDAVQAGFEEVIFIIKRETEKEFREKIGDRIARHVRVHYVFQGINDLPEGFSVPEGRVKPWGTGHAVLSCIYQTEAPIAVINADDYYGKQAFSLIYQYLTTHQDDDETYRYMMVGYELGKTLTENGHVSRGICTMDDKGFLKGICERTHIEKRGDRAAYLEALREISAYMLVDGESPPTLCAYGALDKVVPFVTAEKLRSALQTHGVAHDFIVLSHSGHGLQNDDRLYRLYLSKLDEYLERYL